MSSFKKVFGTKKPVIGMIHLGPLPGSPGYDPEAGMSGIHTQARVDMERLLEGGVDGVMVENQWDRPWLKPDRIGPETVASMAAVVQSLRDKAGIPMGVNVHLNGARQAIAIALATGCRWVRVFELANAYVSGAGIIEAAGPEALRYRAKLKAEDQVMIFGDFHVKHGSHSMIEDKSLEEQACDVESAMGDAVIISGFKTGVPPSRADIERIRKAVSIPVLIGSGLSYENMDELFPLVDGAIVGSHFKEGGRIEGEIDVSKVKQFMRRARGTGG
jgi:membrane complex biogenesis BtpA family protein